MTRARTAPKLAPVADNAADPASTVPPIADKEPRHVLLSPNLGGIIGMAMSGAEIKAAAEVLALLYDAGTADGVTPQDQAKLWHQAVFISRMLWRTGSEIYDSARELSKIVAAEGGDQ
jgi:hypothetical protein